MEMKKDQRSHFRSVTAGELQLLSEGHVLRLGGHAFECSVAE